MTTLDLLLHHFDRAQEHGQRTVVTAEQAKQLAGVVRALQLYADGCPRCRGRGELAAAEVFSREGRRIECEPCPECSVARAALEGGGP